MQQEATDFFAWQARFGTERACLEHLIEERGGCGFICPKCGHDHAHFLPSRGAQGKTPVLIGCENRGKKLDLYP